MKKNYLDNAVHVWYEHLYRQVLETDLTGTSVGDALVNPRKLRDSHVECASLREPGLLAHLHPGRFILGELHVDSANNVKTPLLRIKDMGHEYIIRLGNGPARIITDRVYVKPNPKRPAMVNLFQGASGHQYLSGESLVICATPKIVEALSLGRMFQERKTVEAGC